MSTRGFVGVKIDGTIKTTYNHSDSYPSWLGTRVLEDARTFSADLDGARNLARNVVLVPDSEEAPDPNHIALFKDYANTRVGGPIDNDEIRTYYQLLRGLQGDLEGSLRAGLMIDGGDFPVDSLFCEWGYLVDLDAETFQVYKGFQKETPKAGAWAGRPTQEEIDRDHEWARVEHGAGRITQGQLEYYLGKPDYHAVELLVEYPLASLPDDDTFLAQTEGAE